MHLWTNKVARSGGVAARVSISTNCSPTRQAVDACARAIERYLLPLPLHVIFHPTGSGKTFTRLWASFRLLKVKHPNVILCIPPAHGVPARGQGAAHAAPYWTAARVTPATARIRCVVRTPSVIRRATE